MRISIASWLRFLELGQPLEQDGVELGSVDDDGVYFDTATIRAEARHDLSRKLLELSELRKRASNGQPGTSTPGLGKPEQSQPTTEDSYMQKLLKALTPKRQSSDSGRALWPPLVLAIGAMLLASTGASTVATWVGTSGHGAGLVGTADPTESGSLASALASSELEGSPELFDALQSFQALGGDLIGALGSSPTGYGGASPPTPDWGSISGEYAALGKRLESIILDHLASAPPPIEPPPIEPPATGVAWHVPPEPIQPPSGPRVPVSSHADKQNPLAAACREAIATGAPVVLVDVAGPLPRTYFGVGQQGSGNQHEVPGPIGTLHVVDDPSDAQRATLTGCVFGDALGGAGDDALFFHDLDFRNAAGNRTALLGHQHQRFGLVALFGCRILDGGVATDPTDWGGFGQQWAFSSTGSMSWWLSDVGYWGAQEHIGYFQNTLAHPLLEASDGTPRSIVIDGLRPIPESELAFPASKPARTLRTCLQITNRRGDFPGGGDPNLIPGTQRPPGSGNALLRRVVATGAYGDGGRDFTIAGFTGTVALIECESVRTDGRPSWGAVVAWTEGGYPPAEIARVRAHSFPIPEGLAAEGFYSIGGLELVRCRFDHADNRRALVEVSGVLRGGIDGGEWTGSASQPVFVENTKPWGGPFDNVAFDAAGAPPAISVH